MTGGRREAIGDAPGRRPASSKTAAALRPIGRRALLTTAAVGLAWAGWRGPRAATRPFSLREVAPGHYLHEGVHEMAGRDNLGDIANIGFVVGSEGVAVIDTGGGPSLGADFLAALRAVTDRPIRYVVNTHMHPDHIFGNGVFEALPEAPRFVAHAKLPAALRARTDAYFDQLERDLGEAEARRARMVQPDILVDDRAELDLGDRRLTLRAWPTAHTNNDLTVRDSRTGAFWTGDLVFRTRMPAVDGSAPGWLAVLDKLRREPATTLIPGHGREGETWDEVAGELRRYLEKLVEGVRAVIDRFGTIPEAIETVARDERARWRLFDAYHGRNVTAVFAELEWE